MPSVDASTSASWATSRTAWARPGTSPNLMKFCDDGSVNYPYLSRRHLVPHRAHALGHVRSATRLLAVARQVNQIELDNWRAAPLKVERARQRCAAASSRRHGLGRQGPGQYADDFKSLTACARRPSGQAPPWSCRLRVSREGRVPPSAKRRPTAAAAPAAAERPPHPRRRRRAPSTGAGLLGRSCRRWWASRCCSASGSWSRRHGGSFPTPSPPSTPPSKLIADPFFSNGPNDKGIGWNMPVLAAARGRWASGWLRWSASRSAS